MSRIWWVLIIWCICYYKVVELDRWLLFWVLLWELILMRWFSKCKISYSLWCVNCCRWYRIKVLWYVKWVILIFWLLFLFLLMVLWISRILLIMLLVIFRICLVVLMVWVILMFMVYSILCVFGLIWLNWIVFRWLWKMWLM